MNDFKWFMIFCCVGITCITITAAIDYYTKSQITHTAMENGYSQQVDKETCKVIWVKTKNE